MVCDADAQLMPARAVIDSDGDDAPAGGRGRRIGTGSFRGASGGLAAIDITTPLGEDEVMPEVKPYVVRKRFGRAGGGGVEGKRKSEEIARRIRPL